MPRPKNKSKLEKLLEKIPLEHRQGRQSIAQNLSYDFNKNSYYFYTGKKLNSKGKMSATYHCSKDPIEMEVFIKDFEILDTRQAKLHSALHTKETLVEYLNIFLKNQRYTEAATEIYYEQCLKRISSTFMKDILLCELSTDDCDEYINSQLSRYKPSTVNKDYSFLVMALGKAVKSRKIPHNPMDMVNSPYKHNSDLRKEIKYYDAEDALKIIEYCLANRYKDNKFHNEDKNNVYTWAILISIFTGMRREEVCGLKIEDVFLEDKTPHIEVNNARTDTCEGYNVKDLKNKSSYGTIAIGKEIQDLLKFIITEYNYNKKNNPNFVDSRFIISFSDGTIPLPKTISTKQKKIIEKCGVKEILDFKALRHTFGTLTRDGGKASAFDLQLAMRHASIKTTEKYYLGKSKFINQNAMSSFANMLNKTKNEEKS